jgi:hypothetical protein
VFQRIGNPYVADGGFICAEWRNCFQLAQAGVIVALHGYRRASHPASKGEPGDATGTVGERKGDSVKCAARVALGVAGGYLLGRTKKMKLAVMLGGMAAGRRAGGPGQLLAQGTKLLGQSPELARLTDELRGRLLEAGKGAAVAMATRQVENLTERVVTRVGTLAETGGKTVSDVGDTVGGTVGDNGKSGGGLSDRRSREGVDNDEEYDEEPSEDPVGEPADVDEPVNDAQGEPAGGDEEEKAPAPPRRAAMAGAGTGGRSARGRQGRRNG